MDEEQKELDPEQSLCWNCKYGMCLDDNDVQPFFQPTMHEGNGFESEPEQHGVSALSFPIIKVRSACFWRPEGFAPPMAPLVFNLVKKCSRYEEND